MNLEIVFTHILYSSLIASIMIVILMAVKKLWPSRFPARYIHIIWILILLRLLMPLDIQNPIAMLKVLPEKNQLVDLQDLAELTASQVNVIGQNPEKPNRINTANSQDIYSMSLSLLVPIWLTGFIVLLIFSAFITIRFKRRTRDFKKVLDPEILSLVEQCSGRLNIKKKIPIYMHSYFKSPCIAGVIKPSIYLPEDIGTKAYHYQLEHVLLHELSHHKRKDLICNFMASIAALLHWFNPLVWLAVREMRYDREIASDAYVMEVLGEPGVIPYGMTIINLASLFSNRHKQFNLVSFTETHSQVERRVEMIKMFKKGSYQVTLSAIICFILIGVVTLTTVAGIKPDGQKRVPDNLKGKLVLIDPGHGGQDLGATYPSMNPTNPQTNQVKEKDLNLDIALKLKAMLEKSGLRVAMSRQDDSMVSPPDVVKWARAQNGVFLVSIHNNSSSKSSSNGTVTYSKQVDDRSKATGERAAQIIQARLVKELGTTDLGSKNMKLKILNEVPMPAVMTDIAFISNESDRQKLLSDEFRIKAARALHDAIIEVLSEQLAAESKANGK